MFFASLSIGLCQSYLSHSGQSKHDVTPASYRVDVNTASPATLCLLPGIGASTAARIVAYRERHGRFVFLRELADVPGLGPITLARIRPAAFCGGGIMQPPPRPR